MSEFIGSRISLISKSDIRYVGRLHEINSENSTVALEDVQSFGTEGRRGGADEIPPSDARYEYILFRGSDVKDLRIEEAPKEQPSAPQMPDDPAILGSARPPMGPGPQGPPPHGQPPGPPGGPPFGQYPPYPPMNQGFGRGFPGGPGGPGGFSGYPGMPYNAPPPGWYPPPGQGPPPPQFQGHHGPFAPAPQMPGGPSQRGPAPELPADKPVEKAEKSTSAPKAPAAPKTSDAKAPKPQKAPTPPVESKPDVAAATAPSAPVQILKKPSGPVPTGPKQGNYPAIPRPAPTGAAKPYQDATSAATAAVAAAMAKLPNAGRPAPQPDATIDNLAQRVNQMRTDDQMRPRQQAPRDNNGPQRGRRGGHRGNRDHHGTNKVEIPDTEFDFESANAKFNKSDLVKEVIASGSPLGTPTESNGAALEMTENGKAEEDVVIPAATATAYDKKSSFFDDISSELKEKEQRRMGGGAEFRSEERRRNMETFGQGSVDSYRGGFRGRGRGRGFRGRGGQGGQNFRPRGGASSAQTTDL